MTPGSISNCVRLIEGTPYCLLSSAVISSSLTKPSLTRLKPSLPAVGLLIVQRLLQLRRRDALFFEKQLADANGHRLRLWIGVRACGRMSRRSSGFL